MDTSAKMPQIDETAIRNYCDVVFGYLEGPAAIRLIAEVGTPDQRPQPSFTTVDQIADLLVRIAPGAARDHQAVFVVPATLKSSTSARAEDIQETGVILADLDAGDISAKRDHLTTHLGEPTMIVASGGQTDAGQTKLHLYWQLSEPAKDDDLVLAVRLRGVIALKAGGDESFKSVTQPIRVAGTIHGKNGKLNPVRLLSHTTAEYHLADLAEAVAAMPVLPVTGPSLMIDTGSAVGTSLGTLMTTPIREGAQDVVTRFAANSSVIGHWLRATRLGHITLDEAWVAVQDHNIAMIRPPWTEDRLRREFQALLNRDIGKKGPMPDPDSPDEAAKPAPDLSEDAVAQEFIGGQGAIWHHVDAWGAWFSWSGTHWQKDSRGAAFQAIRLTCRSVARATNKPQDARKLASARTIQSVQKIVAHDPVIAIASDDLDQHPMLLNTPAGVLDLATGASTSHDSGLLLSQITRSSPGTGCPRWLAFLTQVTGGNVELQAYLARLAGYCLTGSTKEQAFFFLHGSGANGKSVFLQTLAWILGNYAATATADTFTNRGPSRHLTELAGLRAARFVLVSETEADEGWAEARIKTVTGGEVIRANFMYKDHFEFVPKFKLVVAGNHRPSLGDVGEAMRRRLHIIPFDVTIPAGQRDPNLADHLKAEANGILGWMIDGCVDWQYQGLSPPAIVTGAVDEYLATEDHIGQWIDDFCETGPTCRAAAKLLFASWSAWARDNGYEVRSTRHLGEQLRGRGFESGKSGGDRAWVGIALRHPLQGGERP